MNEAEQSWGPRTSRRLDDATQVIGGRRLKIFFVGGKLTDPVKNDLWMHGVSHPAFATVSEAGDKPRCTIMVFRIATTHESV